MSAPRRRTALAAWIALLALLLLAEGTAAETVRGRRVRLPPGETVTGDLRAVGGTVELFGTVTGDATVYAGFVNQVGAVAGDVAVRAGRAELRGPIGGSVRADGGSLGLYGTIAGDVELIGGRFTLVEGAVIGGNLTVRGGTLTVVAGARVDGDLRGQVATATIEGTIGGSVDLAVARLGVVAGAAIGGELRYESRAAVTVDPDAAVAGPVTRRDPAARLPAGALLLWHAAAIPRFLALLLLGAALLLLAPGRATALADAPRRAPASTALAGLGIALFAPLALLLLALPVVMLPLALLGGALYLTVAYGSAAICGLALGRALLRCRRGDARRPINLGALGLGLGLVTALRVLPLPLIDGAVAAASAVVGFGAVANRRRGERPREPAGARPRPLAGLLLGVLVGIGAVGLALAALAAAGTGAVGAVAGASRSASFVWTVSPARLGLAALLLAAAAVSLALGAWLLVRRRGV